MPGLKRRGLETERQTGVTVTRVAQPTGKPAEHEGPRTYHTGEATAPVPDPTESTPATSSTGCTWSPWPPTPGKSPSAPRPPPASRPCCEPSTYPNPPSSSTSPSPTAADPRAQDHHV